MRWCDQDKHETDSRVSVSGVISVGDDCAELPHTWRAARRTAEQTAQRGTSAARKHTINIHTISRSHCRVFSRPVRPNVKNVGNLVWARHNRRKLTEI